MNISLNDYLTGRVKNTWNTQKRMDKEVEAGKIRQSTRPASPDQAAPDEEAAAVTEVERTQESAQAAVWTRQASPRTDTVEISGEGLTANSINGDVLYQ